MMILSSTIVVVIVHVIMAQSPLDTLCEECHIENGAGHIGHPSDCTKYISCSRGPDGSLQGTVQQCAFGTYWHNNDHTCKTANNIICPGLCGEREDGDKLKAENTCRGYWECNDDILVAQCCAKGQYYDNITQTCVDNDASNECQDSCIDDPMTTNTDIECELLPDVDPAYYLQPIGGGRNVKMPCPVGTKFVRASCQCEWISLNPLHLLVGKKSTCKPELNLSFKYGGKDQSGKNNFVEYQNVIIKDGKAEFNGINSRLIIPRFSYFHHNGPLTIKLRYTSDHQQLTRRHAIISNNVCNDPPTIQITEDSSSIDFTVGTVSTGGTNKDTSVVVAQTEASEKNVVYKLSKYLFSGRSGMTSNETLINGRLRSAQCALNIGYMQDMPNMQNNIYFKGDIEEITIYLCDPDENSIF